jgi:hypothetical protein
MQRTGGTLDPGAVQDWGAQLLGEVLGSSCCVPDCQMDSNSCLSGQHFLRWGCQTLSYLANLSQNSMLLNAN